MMMKVRSLISLLCLVTPVCFFTPVETQAQTPARLSVRVSADHATLTVSADIGSAWTIQYATGLESGVNWVPLTNAVLTTNPTTVVDPASAGDGTRFYRAISSQVSTNIIT